MNVPVSTPTPEKPLPAPDQVGPYKILRRLGKGGMGEVFLAQDPTLPREIALKRIRPAYANRAANQRRFLREAEVTGQLAHPAIIPILSVQKEPPDLYFTMPYIEGKSLRQFLKESPSIPHLLQIYLRVCEAVAYTHAKGILHRDIKPENIMVGTYGEVILLDWGIAEFIAFDADESAADSRPEKVAGTLAYMSPERLKGARASIQSDLYALGVILYQILTLQIPFARKTIAQYRKTGDLEHFIEPAEIAPQRDIPPALSEIARLSLAKNPQERFATVQQLLDALMQYVEGRPEWTLATRLQEEGDWLPSKHLFLPKHLAISSELDASEWAHLQLSKAKFNGPLKLETTLTLTLSPTSAGVGFILTSLSDQALEESVCLLLGPRTRLYRNYIPIYAADPVPCNEKLHVRIERTDDQLAFYLNNTLLFSLYSHIPLPDLHIGLLSKDEHYTLAPLDIYDASRAATVNCLAIPNALFSHKLYDLALQEYRRIGRSFPGRAEGRDALFRAGLVLLQQARSLPDPQEGYHLAIKEFEQLYRTTGAPLEFLGKSLVYKQLGEPAEEAKCLEYALRRYARHPLISILREYLTYRLFESSIENRESAYRMLLLAYRYLPDLFSQADPQELLHSLQKSWEPLPFLVEPAGIAVPLAFWLGQKHALLDLATGENLDNALFCLHLLGTDISAHLTPETRAPYDRLLKGKFPIDPLPSTLTRHHTRFILAYLNAHPTSIPKWSATLASLNWPKPDREHFDALLAWHYLKRREFRPLTALFQRYEPRLRDDTSPFHLAYGCFLYLSKGPKAAKEHLALAIESPHPPLTALPALFLLGRLDPKLTGLLWWEKEQLHALADRFTNCIGKT